MKNPRPSSPVEHVLLLVRQAVDTTHVNPSLFITHAHTCAVCSCGSSICVLPLLCLQVSVVAEQLLRLLHFCGMPRTDADLIHGGGQVVNELLLRAQPRSTLFTGSQRVAEKLAVDMRGKVRLQAAGGPLGGGGVGGVGDI